MQRILLASACVALTLFLAACADPASNHKHAPQDPPDYKGVPTDMTPPSMLNAPTQPQ